MKQAAGANAPEKANEDGLVTGPKKPLRPAQCRAYMRRTLAREFPSIVQGFVEGAKKGSCQHVKLATELLEEPARRRVRAQKGTVTQLLEKYGLAD
jgi:hypothetical protein